MKFRSSRSARFWIRIAVIAAAALLAVVGIREPRFASGQQLGEGMQRSGTVGIENETERQLFWSLICTCGCPRETLGTCTCGYAHERREELRTELKKGRPVEELKAEYAARFGSQALAVPPNVGANRLLWILPLGAIVAGAGLVITALRRWRRRSDEADAALPAPPRTGKKGKKPKRDDYDDKLDDELKALDE